MGANPAPTWQPITALPLIATMVGEMLDAAGHNYQSLGEARARASMLDDATLDRWSGSGVTPRLTTGSSWSR